MIKVAIPSNANGIRAQPIRNLIIVAFLLDLVEAIRVLLDAILSVVHAIFQLVQAVGCGCRP
jgi:hypothetical protein